MPGVADLNDGSPRRGAMLMTLSHYVLLSWRLCFMRMGCCNSAPSMSLRKACSQGHAWMQTALRLGLSGRQRVLHHK